MNPLHWTSEPGGIVRATLHRPDALNAIDFATMDALDELLCELEASATSKVLIFSGQGPAFVAGGDLKEFATLTTAEQAQGMATRMGGLLHRLEALPIWTIAAIHADAYGGGCELSLAFDFRLLARSARMGFTQARFALPPGWGGLTRLVERVGRARATRWLATAAIVEADEALLSGLVDLAFPDDEFSQGVDDFATRLTGAPRTLIAALKEGAHRAAELPRSEALAAEFAPFCDLWARQEHLDAVNAFLLRNNF